MSNLNQFFGGSLWGGPLIWVQDIKNQGVGGGFYGNTSEQWRVKDMNNIIHNSASGASLTNDSTNSSAVGAVGTQGIVNNTDATTHNALSYVTLPAGTWLCRHAGSVNTSVSGQSYSRRATKLYNVSDGSDIGFLGSGSYISLNDQTNFTEMMFTLSATKNVDIRVMYDSDGSWTSSAGDMGDYASGATAPTVNLSTIFFKVA
jgi:hypothetical protein